MMTRMLLFLGLFLDFSSAMADEEAVPPAEIARVAAKAFHENVESFRRYKCVYELASCKANSLEQVIARKCFDVKSCRVTLVVDRDSKKSSIHNDATGGLPQDKASQPSKSEGSGVVQDSRSSLELPLRELEFEGKYLNYFVPFNQGMISDSPQWDEWRPLSMFMLGKNTLFSPMRLLSLSSTELDSQGVVNRDGRSLVRFRLFQQPPATLNYEYFLDPSQGYLPVEFISHGPLPNPKKADDVTVMVLESKSVADRGFFPMRVIQFYSDSKGVLRVMDLKVLDLKFDDVAEEDFGIEIPAGTLIRDLPGNKFRMKQNQRVYPESMPAISQLAETRSKNPLADTVVPSPLKWYQRAWIYWTAGSVFLLGFCYLFLQGRRSRGVS